MVQKYITTLLLSLASLVLIVMKCNLMISGDGLFASIIDGFFPYVITFVLVVLVFLQIEKKGSFNVLLLNFVLGAVVMLANTYLFHPDLLAKLDWQINKDRRISIVSLVKKGELADEQIPDSLKLWMNCSPNEFVIKKKTDSTLTVLFYTDFGLLDHYSGFFYSDDPVDLKELNRNVLNGGNDFKISENWYRISD